MQKIHLVMPMGGKGGRFENKGFNVPKPLIQLRGKPFFYWAVQSVSKFVDVEDIIFIVLKEHIEKFDIVNKIYSFYPEAKIQEIPYVLNGAVLTCKEGIKDISDSLPILFNDCDHAFISEKFYKFLRQSDFNIIDGALLTFKSNSPNYSYVMFNKYKEVIGTVEKVVVSDEAICGAYYFKNKDVFINAVEKYLLKCSYSELFLSGVYNDMIKCGKKIVTFATDNHISFGTPDEYEIARNNNILDIFG